MNLTEQQTKIIESTGNIKVNAVAGSGKTFTMLEYAKKLPLNANILYLVYNKSVKDEAIEKTKLLGLLNVKVETIHSLAYKHIVSGSDFKIKMTDYKIHDIADILGIKQNESEPLSHFITASLVKNIYSYFFCSEHLSLNEAIKDYVRNFAPNPLIFKGDNNINKIAKYTRTFINKMMNGEIELIHDCYLKIFQMKNKQLNYQYILVDECQDANPAMIDIINKQLNTTKIFVGDVNQQIYRWRYAINALNLVDCDMYNLSNSFRFNSDIAFVANEVLQYKKILKIDSGASVTGLGTSTNIQTRAILARTNIGLLSRAFTYVDDTIDSNTQDIYFEGNINSYTFTEEGTSLYDVLNLYQGNKHRIKDKLILSMKSFGDLEDYVEEVEDKSLKTMIDCVLKFKGSLPFLINRLKERNCRTKEEARIVFSTVFKSKGMEYDEVELVSDFISNNTFDVKDEEDLQELLEEKDKLNDEINILYVAVTRAKVKLIIPKSITPKTVSENDSICFNLKQPNK